MTRQKIIIHAYDGVDLDDAMDYVRLVIRMGKMSGDGDSYCYCTTYPGIVVSTSAPRTGTSTYTFHVAKPS